jgi:hypothetical protein
MNKAESKKQIIGLAKKYHKNRSSYLSSSYNETQLRNDFLNPFFEALGWDIYNESGKSTNEREVILEEGLKAKASESSKKPDYTFRLFSERKFFLEAKKPSVKIEDDSKTARQVRRYGFTAKLKISVLSNFEYLAIYDCSVNVEESDGVKKALIKRYHYTEFEKSFNEIYGYLSQKAVYTGQFDKTWSHIEDRLKLFSVDHLFLKQINEWRLLLGTEIYRNKAGINEQDLNDIVQSYLNSIIFLRVCEDRNLEDYQTLLNFATKKDFKALIAKFQEADKKYNSGLFDQKYTKEIIENNKSVFWTIIKQLYYPESPYSFSVFSSDILGNIYEIFLAEKLSIKNKKVAIEKKAEHVDRDIITTPTHIIQDILRETAIPFCEGKSDKEIIKARFADIACGSGAFLLETFQLLSDILVDYYLQHNKSKLIQTSINTFKLPFDIKRELLINCIYGIDKDYNAVQATKFGLLLKLLESEDNKSIPAKKPILPDLSSNIHFGNSLFGSKEIKKGDQLEINPYDFTEQFDVIVGNPPYMKSEDMKNITPKEFPLYKKHYTSAYKQFDKYFLFIERSLSLLNEDGYLGLIVPSKFAKVGAGKNLRELLKESRNIKQIISFGANQVFQDKTTYTCLLIVNKAEHETFEFFEVKDFTEWKVRDFSKSDFDNVKTGDLANEVWVLVPAYLKEAYKKINQKSITLGELIGEENIFNGIQTSANKIYIHRPIKEDKKYYYFEQGDKNWKIEKGVTRPYFQTSSGNDNLYTYRLFQPNSFVIYPYKKTKKGIEFIKTNELKKNYPFAYKYLLHHKKELSDQKRDIKPEPKTKDEWYRYGRHQSLDKCEVSEKIIVGVLSLGNKYAIDRFQTLISSGGTAGYCMVTMPENSKYSPYYIQALLNSKYLEWYSSLIGEVFRGGYIARGTKVLKQLPVRVIDFKNKKEKALHDKIANLQKELIKIQGEIDKAENNDRLLIPLKRKFDNNKKSIDKLLSGLYSLGKDDNSIPLISDIYATN